MQGSSKVLGSPWAQATLQHIFKPWNTSQDRSPLCDLFSLHAKTTCYQDLEQPDVIHLGGFFPLGLHREILILGAGFLGMTQGSCNGDEDTL